MTTVDYTIVFFLIIVRIEPGFGLSLPAGGTYGILQNIWGLHNNMCLACVLHVRSH